MRFSSFGWIPKHGQELDVPLKDFLQAWNDQPTVQEITGRGIAREQTGMQLQVVDVVKLVTPRSPSSSCCFALFVAMRLSSSRAQYKRMMNHVFVETHRSGILSPVNQKGRRLSLPTVCQSINGPATNALATYALQLAVESAVACQSPHRQSPESNAHDNHNRFAAVCRESIRTERKFSWDSSSGWRRGHDGCA